MSDDKLSAANVQRVLQGALDAADEVMTEFISKKRAAKWDIVNKGLYDAEQLNAELSKRLLSAGIEPMRSRTRKAVAP